jgi:small multidrug resistance pump
MLNTYGLLAIAILAEVIATSLLPLTHHFTRPLPTLGVAIGYGTAFYCLTHVLEKIPIGVTYAIWSGLGIVILAGVGIVIYHQKPDLPAIIGITLILAGVVIINVFSKMTPH